jgi:hypothetical protein
VTALRAVGDAGASAGADLLAAWVERTGRRADKRGNGGLRFAFYGRVSTEDWQDPVTSRARHQDQAAALAAGHGPIVAEFFATGSEALTAWITRSSLQSCWTVTVICVAHGALRPGASVQEKPAVTAAMPVTTLRS